MHLFFRLIFITVFLFGGLISAADRNGPRELPNHRKKEIPRITLKNISPPFKNYEYYRDYKEYGFQFKATAFNIINAWWLAEASTLVYADENFVIEEEVLANQPRDELYGLENPNQPNKRGSASLIPESFKDHVPLLYAIHLWNNVIGTPNY